VNKVSSKNRASEHIGKMANYIYEAVTKLEGETEVLKKGSSEFQEAIEGVTKAIDDIAVGTVSLVSDTEKIAEHISQLEKAILDNYEHIRRVTDNMDKIIGYKNRGLKINE